MTELTFLNDVSVELVDLMGTDASIVRAARVSQVAADISNQEAYAKAPGLINYLMEYRHGSPFEHVTMTFVIEAPIFVAREFMRHRMASYNERSGRYSKLAPRFYIVGDDRPLINTGTSARPVMSPSDAVVTRDVQGIQREAAHRAWAAYENMLNDYSIANEVARMHLPGNIMTQFYVTMNARGLMNFLSLRTTSEDAKIVGYPQLEIQMVADKMERYMKKFLPITYEKFVANGRVAP